MLLLGFFLIELQDHKRLSQKGEGMYFFKIKLMWVERGVKYGGQCKSFKGICVYLNSLLGVVIV